MHKYTQRKPYYRFHLLKKRVEKEEFTQPREK